jgi:hypothetical protein
MKAFDLTGDDWNGTELLGADGAANAALIAEEAPAESDEELGEPNKRRRAINRIESDDDGGSEDLPRALSGETSEREQSSSDLTDEDTDEVEELKAEAERMQGRFWITNRERRVREGKRERDRMTRAEVEAMRIEEMERELIEALEQMEDDGEVDYSSEEQSCDEGIGDEVDEGVRDEVYGRKRARGARGVGNRSRNGAVEQDRPERAGRVNSGKRDRNGMTTDEAERFEIEEMEARLMMELEKEEMECDYRSEEGTEDEDEGRGQTKVARGAGCRGDELHLASLGGFAAQRCQVDAESEERDGEMKGD